jgi:lipoprotein-anchoring transpeptidase ErfK/SrfK
MRSISIGLALTCALLLVPAGASGALASETEPDPTPVAATRDTKARNVPAYPTRSQERGKRVVYDKSLMTIWLIDDREQVVARFPVVGRPDRPAPGVYRVYSTSKSSANPIQKLTFKNMVRFARGQNTGAPIGFHDIPRTYDGRPIHGENVLGLPLGAGGCVRMATAASEVVYAFANVGTTVEVIAPA